MKFDTVSNSVNLRDLGKLYYLSCISLQHLPWAQLQFLRIISKCHKGVVRVREICDHREHGINLVNLLN